MSLIADHRFYGAHSNSVIIAQNKMLEIISKASLIYKFTDFTLGIGIGISLKVRHLLVYETSSASTNTFMPDTTLSGVFLDQLNANRESPSNICLRHAFTAQTFSGGVLGLAFVGTICGSSTSDKVNLGYVSTG